MSANRRATYTAVTDLCVDEDRLGSLVTELEPLWRCYARRLARLLVLLAPGHAAAAPPRVFHLHRVGLQPRRLSRHCRPNAK